MRGHYEPRPKRNITLLQLVYTSIARRRPDPPEITDLCEQARRNNRVAEITGVLVAKDGWFLQALEGPKEAVEDTFLRIIQDSRHSELLLISRRVTTLREFGQWDMAYCEEPGQVDAIVKRVAALTEGAPQPIQNAFADFLKATE